MLHLRVIAPADLTEQVLAVLHETPGATGIVLVPKAGQTPPGDLVTADLAREAANDVLDGLDALQLRERGIVALEEIDTALSAAADRAEAEVPGESQDAVVWHQIEDRTEEQSRLSWVFVLFLTIATIFAGIGVLLDQPILIVGAMVVGPEFGPLAGICVGLARRHVKLLRQSVQALLVGFVIAIGVTVLLTLLGHAAGLVDSDMLNGDRPLTRFISNPDVLSFVVAFLAGIVGMLSLTAPRSGALIGVLISVTTVPAAGNAAVALALDGPSAATGSLWQLLVNMGGIILSGTLTLLVARMASWNGRVGRYWEGSRSRRR